MQISCLTFFRTDSTVTVRSDRRRSSSEVEQARACRPPHLEPNSMRNHPLSPWTPMSRIRLSVSLASVLALAACTSDLNDPVRPIAPSSASSSLSSAPGQYVVLSRGNSFSADFADKVAALGGKIESLHK